MRNALLVFAAVMAMAVPVSAAGQDGSDAPPAAQLITAYETIVAVEHDSRHLYHLQTKALVAHLGGWARPANEDGSEIDVFSGVSEQVIPLNLNRIKAQLRRGRTDKQTAPELAEIITLFEAAIPTGLEISRLLEAGNFEQASEFYRTRSVPEYEKLWRRTFTLMRGIERRL
ncbi:hypothetical protein [Leisingera sp. McT4-56]|uniref:hypothetical protein n=1 Tax=Leisingera sp. McT4-56 TaxID=2881255 RepID=UPI001CF86776|nr:hypothetical protein [Leisingera sp. McT4-56]MCB4455770.1 hypothetical protein [Leisingera sp. McT4-56]